MDLIKIKEWIFGADIRLIVNCSKEKFSAYCKQCFNVGCIPEKDGYFTVYDNGEKVVYLIYISQFNWLIQEHALLTHELYHCVYRVMKDIGASLCDESEEVFANYFQYLHSEVMSKLKDKVK